MFKSTTGLEADDFQAVFEVLETGPQCENIKFYDGQNNKKTSSYPLKMLNLEKRQSSSQSICFLCN